jgi:hypothetical protein
MAPRFAALAALLAAACIVPAQTSRQVGAPATQLGTPAGAPTTAVSTGSGVAIGAAGPSTYASLEPVVTPVSQTTSYLVDPRTHTCLLVYAGRFFPHSALNNVNVPVTTPVDCALLAASVPSLQSTIAWVPRPQAPAPAATPSSTP